MEAHVQATGPERRRTVGRSITGLIDGTRLRTSEEINPGDMPTLTSELAALGGRACNLQQPDPKARARVIHDVSPQFADLRLLGQCIH